MNPPPGWQPDPAWGPPPSNWPLWVDDNPDPATQASGAPPRPWFRRKRFVIPIGVVAVLTVGGALAPDDDKSQATSASPPSAPTVSTPATPTATPLTSAPPQRAEPAKVPPPEKSVAQPPAKLSQQQRFVALVEDARTKAEDAENDFQRRLPLTNRNKSICKLLKSKTVSGWSGTVETLDTNGDGLGVLTIKIADGVEVSTWNNALSDFQDHTLIKTDSPVFTTMATLSEGDRVTFGGSFVRDSDECISEQSITDDGSTETPTFTMRFSKLARA